VFFIELYKLCINVLQAVRLMGNNTYQAIFAALPQGRGRLVCGVYQ